MSIKGLALLLDLPWDPLGPLSPGGPGGPAKKVSVTQWTEHTPHVSHSSLSTYVFPCGGWYGWRCKGRSSIPEVGTKLPGSPFSPLGPGCPVPGRDRTGQITCFKPLNHFISTHYCVYIIPRLFPVPGLKIQDSRFKTTLLIPREIELRQYIHRGSTNN